MNFFISLRSIFIEKSSKMTWVWLKKWPKMGQKWPKIGQKSWKIEKNEKKIFGLNWWFSMVLTNLSRSKRLFLLLYEFFHIFKVNFHWKILETGRRLAQRWPKMGQNWAKMAPKWVQNRSKFVKNRKNEKFSSKMIIFDDFDSFERF